MIAKTLIFENALVWTGPKYLPIVKFIHGVWHMSRWWIAVILIPIIFWQQVHIVKNEALVLVELKCFLEANVKQHGTVERRISWLFHEKVIMTILKTTSQQNSPQGGTSYGVWRGNDKISWLIPYSPPFILDQKWFELNLFPSAMNGWPALTSSVICTLR